MGWILILVGITIVIQIPLSIGLWVYILNWQWRKKDAGAVLLHIDQIFLGKFLFWIGIFILFLTVVFGLIMTSLFHAVSASTPPNEMSGILWFFWIMVLAAIGLWHGGIAIICVSFGGFQLRENGICSYFSFNKWGKYTSYTWKSGKNPSLLLRYKSRSFILRKVEGIPISIPLKHKNAVDKILAQYIARTDERN